MPNVAELIRDHVTVEVECVDRLYLNGYIPTLQTPEQLVAFLRRHRGHPIPSPKLLGDISQGYRRRVEQFARQVGAPMIPFEKGQRKDDVAKWHHARFKKPQGVVFIGVAQEKAWAFGARPQRAGRQVHFAYRRQSVCVTHYYFYVLDPEWGPAFLKVCTYAPFAMKLCLNGHEWLKRQLAKRGVAFTALDNGIASCREPEAVQKLADRLSAQDIQQFFERWLRRLPMPLLPKDFAAGYQPRLSLLQLEVSLTQVFDRPIHGREFFEEVIRENLDLGRPDRVQLLFDRKLIRTTPSRFRTRVIHHGVAPSLHVEYKHSGVKQYFKEDRALRTETTINDPYDFGIKRSLKHFDSLRQIGRQINRRLLMLERVAQDCTLSAHSLQQVVLPSVHQGQRAPGLRVGDPRVMALLAALCTMGALTDGVTNRLLRPCVRSLLGGASVAYTTGQMSYDLRRLVRKGLLHKLPGRHRYMLTPQGRRWAIFITKTYARILRPGFQQMELEATAPPTPALHQAFGELDRVLDQMVTHAKLAA
jgi:hypothetical protein